ncbi:flippase-like domain-containing protein [Vreelandella titanicae]
MGPDQGMFTRLGACSKKLARRSPWLRRVVVSLALLGAVAMWVEPQAIVAEVQRFSAEWVVLALAISTLQIMLCAWRWQFTAGLIDVPLRFAYALREYYLALLVNQLLPGGVLGDAGRAHRHATQAQSRGRAWRAVIIERASGQVAVVMLTLTALLFSPLWHAALGGAVITAVGLSALAALAAIIVSGLLLRQRFSPWLAGLPSWCQALARDVRRGLLRRGVWPQQLLSSLAIVLSYGLVMVCAARAIGVELPSLQVLALTPVLLLAMLIPFSVAGWGLREGAAAGVWALVGLPPAQGVAVSLAYGVLVLLASLPGIWVALSRREKAQPSGGGIPQSQVEQRVVTAAESPHGRAQRTLKGLNRRHLQPWPTGADQQRGDQQMQSINGSRFDKLRHRNAAAFYQHPRQALLGQQGDNTMGSELTAGVQGQYATFNVGQARRCLQLRPYVRPHDMQRRGAIGVQQCQVAGNAAAWIQHHPRRVSAANMAHGQLRVIGAGGTRADHHCVDQSAQTMQVNQTFMAVDVVGVAAFRGNAAIHTLSQLRHHPRRSTGQRGQAIEQLSRLSGDRFSRLPLAGWRQGDRHIARAPMTQRQQPFPSIGQRNNVDMGFGHDASVLENPLHHAGSRQLRASCLEQACAIPLVRKPGGLHVPD